MADDDLIILGLGALALYLLTQRGSAAQAAPALLGDQTPACSRGGVDMCTARKVGGDIPITSPTEAPKNDFAQYWEQTPGASTGVYRPKDIDYANPRLGSAVNDATLLMLNRQIDAYNAVGNWDASSQIAKQRDAWIKQQGY